MNISEEVGSLISLVDYQDGSIVSKEVIKREKGTVTLFAFDKGQGLSEHIAPFDALVYIFDGKAEINIAGKQYCLKARFQLCALVYLDKDSLGHLHYTNMLCTFLQTRLYQSYSLHSSNFHANAN